MFCFPVPLADPVNGLSVKRILSSQSAFSRRLERATAWQSLVFFFFFSFFLQPGGAVTFDSKGPIHLRMGS